MFFPSTKTLLPSTPQISVLQSSESSFVFPKSSSSFSTARLVLLSHQLTTELVHLSKASDTFLQRQHSLVSLHISLSLLLASLQILQDKNYKSIVLRMNYLLFLCYLERTTTYLPVTLSLTSELKVQALICLFLSRYG